MKKYNNKKYLLLFTIVIIILGCKNSNSLTKSPDVNNKDIVYPLETTIYGQQISGCEGDFSGISDVFKEHGIRISPRNKEGRAFYDFGPVDQDSITVAFHWMDNGWVSGLKAFELFNWQTKKWEIIISWEGNDKKEHTETYKVQLKSEYVGINKQVRIGLYASKYAVIHLDNISVK